MILFVRGEGKGVFVWNKRDGGGWGAGGRSLNGKGGDTFAADGGSALLLLGLFLLGVAKDDNDISIAPG